MQTCRQTSIEPAREWDWMEEWKTEETLISLQPKPVIHGPMRSNDILYQSGPHHHGVTPKPYCSTTDSSNSISTACSFLHVSSSWCETVYKLHRRHYSPCIYWLKDLAVLRWKSTRVWLYFKEEGLKHTLEHVFWVFIGKGRPGQLMMITVGQWTSNSTPTQILGYIVEGKWYWSFPSILH